MTNEELLAQIAKMFQTQKSLVSDMLEEQDAKVADMLESQTAKMALLIENTITKRLDALFDGYVLVRDKQWDLEQRVEILERQAV